MIANEDKMLRRIDELKDRIEGLSECADVIYKRNNHVRDKVKKKESRILELGAKEADLEIICGRLLQQKEDLLSGWDYV